MYNLHCWRTILKNSILKKKTKTSNTWTTEFHYFAIPDESSSITANITKREQDLMETQITPMKYTYEKKKKKIWQIYQFTTRNSGDRMC